MINNLKHYPRFAWTCTRVPIMRTTIRKARNKRGAKVDVEWPSCHITKSY